MSRRPTPSGVGRGNGTGSLRTQFKSGMPSGNPAGRPRRPKVVSDPTDFGAALARVMASSVDVNVDGRRRKMPRVDVVARNYLETMMRGSPQAQTAALKFIFGAGGAAAELRNGDIPASAIADFVEGIAAELKAAGLSVPDLSGPGG